MNSTTNRKTHVLHFKFGYLIYFSKLHTTIVLFFEVRELHMSLYPQYLMLLSPNICWRLNSCLWINSHAPKRILTSLKITDIGLLSYRRSGGWAQWEWNVDKSRGDWRPDTWSRKSSWMFLPSVNLWYDKAASWPAVFPAGMGLTASFTVSKSGSLQWSYTPKVSTLEKWKRLIWIGGSTLAFSTI